MQGIDRSSLARGAALTLAAGAALAFANGQYAHPLMAWLAPVLALRLTRSRPAWAAMLAGYAAFLAAWIVAWAAVFRLDGAELAPAALALSAIGFLPYLVDRLAIRRMPAMLGTLAFPLAMVAIELGLAAVSPFGSWGLIAYSQVEFPPVAQLAALTGPAGITFLVCWFSSVAALAWEHRRAPERWRAPAAAFAVVAVAAIGWGAARISTSPGTASVRVAIVLPPVQGNRNYDAALAPAIEAGLATASRTAARAGARIIVWPENSFFLPAADEAALTRRASAIARSLGVHLGIAYGLRVEPGTLRYRNRFVLFGPDGGVAWRYDKSHAVPGYEQAHMVRGDGRVPRAATPIGEIAGAICFDGDHDAVLDQFRTARLALLPSDDWPAIATLHARMVRLRAVAANLPVVRPTINGVALVADRFGRPLASVDSRRAANPVLLADVPLD